MSEMTILDCLYYWETHLELPFCASDDPVKRLDYLIEGLRAGKVSRAMILQLTAENKRLQRRNRVLEARWTQLRTLLGIQNRHEDKY